MLVKPSDVFDRDWEWGQLAQFATSERAGAALGVVTGRRRQGKTFLLEALCEATEGFCYAATEALPRVEALRQLGEAVAEFRGQPGAVRYDDWSQASTGCFRSRKTGRCRWCWTSSVIWCATPPSCPR